MIFEVRKLDKYEYNLKLDQLKSLCAEEKYEAAAEIADSINWNKIKNVNALVKAGEVYEKMERYQESRDILLMAYDRSPIGRNIVFRLAEVAIKMKDFDSATEYYNEFVEIAPHDNLRYIIQYDMKKAQGAEVSELIRILEELKDVEYTEEWAYELAYLYHKAGMSEKCVDACDELILWFGDGVFVERALELKMLYQPLSKSQEEKYRRFRMDKQGVTTIGAEEMERAGEYAHETVEIPRVDVNTRFNTVNLQAEIAKGIQQIMDAKEKTEVSDSLGNILKIAEELPILQLTKGADGNNKNDQEQKEIEEDINNTLKLNFKELLDEESDGQMSIVTADETALEHQITGQLSIDEVLGEWEKTKRAAETALQQAEQQKLETAKARALQEAEDIMVRLNDVIPKLDAGISPKTLLEQEYMQAAAEELPKVTPVYVGKETAKNEDGYPVDMPEEISEGMLEKEDTPLEELDREPLPEVLSLDDEDAEFEPEFDEEQEPKVEEEPEALDEEHSSSDRQPAIQIESTKDAPLPEQPGELFNHVNQILGQHIDRMNDENDMIDAQIAQAAEAGAAQIAETASSILSGTDAVTQTIAETIEDHVVPHTDEMVKEPMADEVLPEEEAATEPDTTKMPEAEPEELTEKIEESAEEPPVPVHDVEQTVLEPVIEEEPVMDDSTSDSGIESANEAEEEIDPEEKLSNSPMQRMKTKPMPTLREFQKQQKVSKKKKSVIPKELDAWKQDINHGTQEDTLSLTDAQKAVFSYFVPVAGMENQLAKALGNISTHLKKKEPAYTGNLIVQGGQGCGKTVLATSMVKALQNEIGKPNNKIGKIDAYTLNKKDIQLLLKKVSGGCLIIEHAGVMSKQAAVTLSLLLEQDDSGLLVILEDTSKGIKKVLAQDDGLAKKFTEKISVPVFTNDDLVAFANSYSKELGYKIDEMAILALYNRISNIQRLDQATTLTEIKDIVDEAIEREAHGGLHKYFSILTAKRYSDDDRIILQEKDFN